MAGHQAALFLVIFKFSLLDLNGSTGLKFPGKVYCTVLRLGKGLGADCALFSVR
jgi:hypothetical protein